MAFESKAAYQPLSLRKALQGMQKKREVFWGGRGVRVAYDLAESRAHDLVQYLILTLHVYITYTPD